MDSRGRNRLSDRFLVYRTMEAGARDRHVAALRAHLEAPGPGRFLEPAFHHAPTGPFRLFDHGRLWKNRTQDLLPATAEVARDAATRYMRAVNAAAGRHRTATSLSAVEYPDPFPVAALRHVRTTPAVSASTAGAKDHWLSRWECHLPVASPFASEGKEPVPVFGGEVELRIGPRGQVVGVVSHIRPWTAVFPRQALAPPRTGEDDHSHDDLHENEAARPRLCYVMEAMRSPQRFLSPCWVRPRIADEPHTHRDPTRRLFPATDLSLIIELDVQHGDDDATVRVIALGAAGKASLLQHGGAWRVAWRWATLDGFARGGAERSNGSSVRLPGPGLYQVEVVIEDLARENVQSTCAQIPVLPKDGRPPREAPRG